MTVDRLWNATAVLTRAVETADGAGGQTTSWATVGTVPCRVSQPSATDRQVASADEAEITGVVHVAPDTDVRRDDRFNVDNRRLRVLAVLEPSVAIYRRCDCIDVIQEA